MDSTGRGRFALVIASAFSVQALAGLSPEGQVRLDEFLDTYVAEGKIPGAVLQVTLDGRTAYHRAVGFRDRRANSTMQPDTIFRIASMSKPVTSAAVLMLQEREALAIGQPVGDFLPEYRSTTVATAVEGGDYEIVDSVRPITIRDLLTHTAGIGYGNGLAAAEWQAAGLDGGYFGRRDEPVREIVRRIARLPMDAQPGTFVYGYGTDILGALVEVASGESLDVFLEAEIFGPLGMADTSFDLSSDKAERLAAMYTRYGEHRMGRLVDYSGHYVGGRTVSYSGGAGLLSTTDDYTRFLEAIRQGGGGILSRESVELMTTDQLGDDIPWMPGHGFGLGFGILRDIDRDGRPSTIEFHWDGSYHTMFWVDPVEKLTVVYMAQLRRAIGLDDFRRIRALIYQALTRRKQSRQR
ncbi:MAG: serine hydrolase [Gammaproteobacteria bacterium]|nr:serine hydrolase [Gammaproteobacteria bacterium]